MQIGGDVSSSPAEKKLHFHMFETQLDTVSLKCFFKEDKEFELWEIMVVDVP